MKSIIIEGYVAFQATITKEQAQQAYGLDIKDSHTIEIADVLEIIHMPNHYAIQALTLKGITPQVQIRDYLAAFVSNHPKRVHASSDMDYRGLLPKQICDMIQWHEQADLPFEASSYVITRSLTQHEQGKACKSIWIADSSMPLYTSKPLVCVNLIQAEGMIKMIDEDEEKHRVDDRLVMGYYFGKKEMEMTLLQAVMPSDKILPKPLFLKAPLKNQGHFDILIQKLNPLLASNNPHVMQQCNNYISFIKESTNCTYVHDNPENMNCIMSRIALQNTMETILGSSKFKECNQKYGHTLLMPFSVIMQGGQAHQQTLNQLSSIHPYKFIIKPCESTETSISHLLTIITSEEAMKKALLISEYFGKQLLVQHLSHHYGTQYKVYTIGRDFVTYFLKESIPTQLSVEMHTFNSQKPFPSEWKSQCEMKDRMNRHYLESACGIIVDELKLSMLGIDIVIDEEGHYFIADLNYFSSYRCMKEIASVLHPLLVKKYYEKMKLNKQINEAHI